MKASPLVSCRPVMLARGLAILALLLPVIGYGAESVYTGGNNRDNLSKGLWGPLNLGDRAKYGMIQLRGNQEFTYDDNLFMVQDGKTKDWASVTSPGMMYRLGSFDNNAVEVGYDANITRYFLQTRESGEEQMPYLRMKFTMGKTTLTISDQLDFIQGGESRLGGNETTARVLKTQNNSAIITETKLDDKLTLGTHFNTLFYNPKGALLQRTQIDGGVTVYYKAFAQADLYFEANGGHVDVLRGGREDFTQQKFGVRGQLTPKLEGKLDVGLEERSSTRNGVGSQVNGLVGCALKQTFTDDLQLSLRANRSVNNSIAIAGQTFVSSTVGMNLYYQFGPVLNKETKVRKLAFALDASYENDDFDLANANGTRQNLDLYTVAPSFEYRIQDYWKLYVVYRYQDNDSNQSGGDFVNNRISLGSSVLF